MRESKIIIEQIPVTIDNNGVTYVPLDFIEVILNGKKHGYVMVNQDPLPIKGYDGIVRVIRFLTPLCFEELKHIIDSEEDFTENQKASLRRVYLGSARKCQLRRDGRIKIPKHLTKYTGISSDIWFAKIFSKIGFAKIFSNIVIIRRPIVSIILDD